MGGYGSGSYYRSTKTTVNDCRSLDINRMVKQGSIPKQGRRSGLWVWTDAETGEQKSSISYEADTSNPSSAFLKLRYKFKDRDDWIDYKIRLTRTPMRYGGERFWFVCPSTGKRVSKLYLPLGGDYFASRQAYRLAYKSQSESSHDRAMRKYWRLKNRLGGEDEYYFKPKGMHQKNL